MTLNDRIAAFTALGKFLSQFDEETTVSQENILYNDIFFDDFSSAITQAKHYNGWFLPEEVKFSFANWADALTKENLETWSNKYDINNNSQKTVGIVMAGNIPLVGFHDLLSILISGHKVLIKLSSNDNKLIPLCCEYLIRVNDNFKSLIEFTHGQLKDFDAVIATGSNNTARYFDYYFGKFPNIIRKNRNSIAVLTGSETTKELEALGEDIFRYFGLGCRSVSKIFVPKDYNFDTFFKAMYKFKYLLDNDKYANNYDYNKAVYLMSEFKILDNGFLILKEDESYASPIGSLFYEYYDSIEVLSEKFSKDVEKIQCIVNFPQSTSNVEYGATQKPTLTDYADGVDTMEFLLKI